MEKSYPELVSRSLSNAPSDTLPSLMNPEEGMREDSQKIIL